MIKIIRYIFWPWGIIKRLRKVLDETFDSVYPKAVKGGKNPYEKRTKYMEGWNDCVMKATEAQQNILKNGDWR